MDSDDSILPEQGTQKEMLTDSEDSTDSSDSDVEVLSDDNAINDNANLPAELTRNNKSDVWNHTTDKYHGKIKKQITHCKYCNVKWTFKNTSTVRRHLEKHHPTKYDRHKGENQSKLPTACKWFINFDKCFIIINYLTFYR